MFRKSLVFIAITVACVSGSSKSSIPDGPASITGRVTAVTPSADGGRVRVEASPEDVSGSSAKAVVRITPSTTVIVPDSGNAGFGALRAGQWVRVWFVGPVMQSQPVQASAGTIVIDAVRANAATDSIVLERSMCFGTCPAYRLRLSASGEIRFESRNPGDKIGAAIDTVNPVTLSSLVSRARSIGFFDLPEKIMGDSVLCPVTRTDAPGAVVAIFTKDGTTRVDDYYGCVDRVEHKVVPAISRLRAFESEIDSVLQSSRWVRSPSRR